MKNTHSKGPLTKQFRGKRGNYAKIPPYIRMELADLVENQGMSIKNASLILKMKYSTAKHIMRLYSNTGRLQKDYSSERQARNQNSLSNGCSSRSSINMKSDPGNQTLSPFRQLDLSEVAISSEEESSSSTSENKIKLNEVEEHFSLLSYEVKNDEIDILQSLVKKESQSDLIDNLNLEDVYNEVNDVSCSKEKNVLTTATLSQPQVGLVGPFPVFVPQYSQALLIVPPVCENHPFIISPLYGYYSFQTPSIRNSPVPRSPVNNMEEIPNMEFNPSRRNYSEEELEANNSDTNIDDIARINTV